jgi:hypothetical protein
MREEGTRMRLIRDNSEPLQPQSIEQEEARQLPAIVQLPPLTPQKTGFAVPTPSSPQRLQQRTTDGLKRLESQAKRINLLSTQLETAVLEFKAIASEINRDWKAIQSSREPSTYASICEYRATAVPQVVSKQDGSFKLIARPVDLFQAEREASLLAQVLRRRARKKQSTRRKKY